MDLLVDFRSWKHFKIDFLFQILTFLGENIMIEVKFGLSGEKILLKIKSDLKIVFCNKKSNFRWISIFEEKKVKIK